MVWACFSSNGVGNIVFINEKMDSLVYVRILRENMNDSARKMGLSEFVFQQDNDPKHTSKISKEFFQRNGIKLLEWPAQSPDLNPIERLWAYMKRKLKECPPKNIKELRATLLKIWNEIPKSVCEKLVGSFSNRIEEVIRMNGCLTRY